MIWLGCSGWNYKEWFGVFYPSYIRDQLRYYSQMFNSVEINSTFYGNPEKEIVQSWCKKVGDRKDFRFSIKMPGSITHDLFFSDRKSCVNKAVDFERQILGEMDSAGKLGACLIQMSSRLSMNYWDDFTDFLGNLDSSGYKYFVELRNSDMELRSASETLGNMGIGTVSTDTPVANLSSLEVGTKYIRLHGRNVAQWESKDEGMSKYKYLYNMDEIRELSATIKKSVSTGDDIFIYFNNHHEGNAPMNAISLGMELGLRIGKGQDQKKLF
ncbi:MAG: DUF72 domain-containing protein [Thermoplasmataceae archaeon]